MINSRVYKPVCIFRSIYNVKIKRTLILHSQCKLKPISLLFFTSSRRSFNDYENGCIIDRRNTRCSPLLLSFCGTCTSRRYFASKKEEKDKVKPPIKFYRLFLTKLVSFITDSKENLEDKLEKRIPNVFHVYKTFSSGVKAFVADTKEYYNVSQNLWRGGSLKTLSRKQLQLYSDFSGDLPLIGLMMVIAFAPGGLFVFPLAYVFPRFLLSQHFWTANQRLEFGRIKMKEKLINYDHVVNYMDLLCQYIDDSQAEKEMRFIIHKLDNSIHLTPKEILDKLPYFAGKPYRIESMSIRHIRHLARANGLSLRKKNLVKGALLLQYTDMAMKKEGINTMENDDLDIACSKRGLHPQGLDRLEKIRYLETWIQISTQIEESNISLLLHLPVLLGYTRPTNRGLMGPVASRHTL